MMTVIFLICVLFLFHNVEGIILSADQIEFDSTNITNCISRVLYKFHEHNTELTLFNMDADTTQLQEIVKAVHSMIHVKLVIKNLWIKRPTAVNEAYMILADTAEMFALNFYRLQRDKEWNPMARFYIIIKHIDVPMQLVFKKLLAYHVNNVIVINGDLNIFTYFPFENGACGRRFDEVHMLSHCMASDLPDLFPNKLINGLKNCTFKVLATHFPPYVVEGKGKKVKPGLEQCALEMLAKIEKFNLTYEFSNIVDEFSTVNDDMEAIGPLRTLQNNTFDILSGGMFLIENRARPFTYLYGQTAYLDEIRIFVRVAEKLAKWKIFYIEFDITVWIMIIASFIIYSAVCIVLMRNDRFRDKCTIILKLWDNLFLHEGVKFHVSLPTKCVFIIWLWFTFLLNSYYQTSLTSLTTTLVNDYQVKTMEDLLKYNYKPCLSSVIKNYMFSTTVENRAETNETDCRSFLGALMVVNKGHKLYTISSLSTYESEQTKFINEEGKSSLYVFPTPLNKLLTSLFFYKGFPKSEKFLMHTLTMRETGLMDHCLKQLFSFYNDKENKKQGGLNYETKYVVELNSLLIPYAILAIGVALSSFVFALEIIIHKKNNSLKQKGSTEIPRK